MPQHLTLAVSQSHTLSTTSATLQELGRIAHQAARSGAHLLLLPEAYLGGYPRTCTFGASVGSRSNHGREQFLQYFHDAIDLGDTPGGEGEDWVEQRLPVAKGKDFRGDGTRERLEKIARDTGVFLVVGVVERAGGSLYCAVLYVCPQEGCLGKRRKVMPTGSERLIWAQGSPSTLRAITTVIRGVNLTLAAAICWENYMPLLRFSLYSQNVNLYLAPTADGKETWLPLMQTIACEGRTFVLSANQCLKRKNLPKWIRDEEEISNEVSQHAAKITSSSSRSRRLSSVTKTEDDHEITWPQKNAKATEEDHVDNLRNRGDGREVDQSPPGRFSEPIGNKVITTKIEDNHEIKWPPPPSTPNYRDEETSHTQKGATTPSPLRSGTISINDETHDEAKTTSKSPGIPRRPLAQTKLPENHLVAIPSTEAPSKSHSHATFELPTDTPPTIAQDQDQEQPPPSTKDDDEEFVSHGGSCIISPTGTVLAGPLWDNESGLLFATVDFEDCERGRLDIDVAGSYGRLDAFDLRVRGLDISPPP